MTGYAPRPRCACREGSPIQAASTSRATSPAAASGWSGRSGTRRGWSASRAARAAWRCASQRWRAHLGRAITRAVPAPRAAVLRALVLGDESGIDDTVRERVHADRPRARPVGVGHARRAGGPGQLRARPLARRTERAPAARRRRPPDCRAREPGSGRLLQRAGRAGGRHAALGAHGRARRRGGAGRPSRGRAADARAGGRDHRPGVAGGAPRDRLPAVLRVRAGDRPRHAALGARYRHGLVAGACASRSSSPPRHWRVPAR